MAKRRKKAEQYVVTRVVGVCSFKEIEQAFLRYKDATTKANEAVAEKYGVLSREARLATYNSAQQLCGIQLFLDILEKCAPGLTID